MTAGERFKNWIDGLAESWKDLLRGWVLRTIGEGITKTLEDMEPGAIKSFKGVLTKLKDDPLTPPEMMAFYARALEPGNWLTELVAGMIMGLTALPALLGAGIPLGNIMGYIQDRELKSFRLDPAQVITAWRRDKDKYAGLFEDLKDQGWSDERIEALKFHTLFYPAPADLIRWQAREVFEPEMITRYGLDSEFGAIEKEPFYKAGMTDEQILNYWRAHWEHASWMQVVEMLHRDLLTEEQVYDWFRVVEIPPYWRNLLIQTAYTWPTRVDVRRWWDMRTIDEAELRRLYSGMGYRGVNLDNYVLWTKVYTAFPDLMARWSKGWISLDKVKSELTGLGMPAARVEEMIQTKIQSTEPERVAGERDLTKTDIYKGIKADRITRSEGIELLIDLGFDEDEADLLVDTNVPEDITDKVVAQRELTKADILNGLKTEVITRDQARTRLLDLRYSPVDAEFLLKIFDAQVKPPEEPAAREASKADIVAAVKKGLITPEDAYLMLQDIGFTPEAAMFILEVKAEVSPFSPINFAEFKDRTTKYKIAAGLEERPMPEEIKKAAGEVVKLTADLEALQKSIDTEQLGLVKNEVLPEAATLRLKSLQVKRNRAISSLEKAKSDYNRLIAEWRHGLP